MIQIKHLIIRTICEKMSSGCVWRMIRITDFMILIIYYLDEVWFQSENSWFEKLISYEDWLQSHIFWFESNMSFVLDDSIQI